METTNKPCRLKLGWISYLNLFPLRCEILEHLSDTFEVTYGHPAFINQKLRSQQIDLAPSSSICLLKDKPLSSLPLGVVSKGEVLSVYLGFQKEHKSLFKILCDRIIQVKKKLWSKSFSLFNLKDFALRLLEPTHWNISIKLPPLYLTTESQTSLELTKIILTCLLGPKNYKTMKDHQSCDTNAKPVTLLIGDEALDKKSHFNYVLDLGKLWTDLTKLPFVYAVWQSNLQLPTLLQEKLVKLTVKTQEKMHKEPNIYQKKLSLQGIRTEKLSLPNYWNSIYYEIGKLEQRGLALFLTLVKLLESHKMKNKSEDKK